MVKFLGGMFQAIGLVLILGSIIFSTTTYAEIVESVPVASHTCSQGGFAPNNCTCSGKCTAPQGQWDCICGMITHPNGAQNCWCGCSAQGRKC